jgi:hypothetical protein
MVGITEQRREAGTGVEAGKATRYLPGPVAPFSF